MIEFWCIMDLVRPGLLGSWKDFRDRYERPLTAASTEEERQPLVRELLGHLGPHYLRRLKDEVLPDLPPKAEHRYAPRLSDVQLDQYRQIARAARAGGQGAALGALTRLLMICGHPQVLEAGPLEYSPGLCPKLDETLRLLGDVRATGEKALAFTRFRSLQRILRDAIRETLEIWPDIINGDLTKNRQQVMDVFQQREGFNVLILSQEVGGVGLNLTAANHVIHYTRPWNPAQENQATDRVHRFGQDKDVHVHLPIITYPDFVTVEQRLKRFSNRPCTTWGGRGTSARTDAGGPMRAYSMDLRERALLDSDAGMKAADVAAKYRVSGSWVRLLKQRRRDTGEVAPRVQRQGRRGMLEPHLHTLAALIAAHPDRTLAELKDALATPASVPTVWRAVRALGLTVTKNGPPVRTRSA